MASRCGVPCPLVLALALTAGCSSSGFGGGSDKKTASSPKADEVDTESETTTDGVKDDKETDDAGDGGDGAGDAAFVPLDGDLLADLSQKKWVRAGDVPAGGRYGDAFYFDSTDGFEVADDNGFDVRAARCEIVRTVLWSDLPDATAIHEELFEKGLKVRKPKSYDAKGCKALLTAKHLYSDDESGGKADAATPAFGVIVAFDIGFLTHHDGPCYELDAKSYEGFRKLLSDLAETYGKTP